MLSSEQLQDGTQFPLQPHFKWEKATRRGKVRKLCHIPIPAVTSIAGPFLTRMPASFPFLLIVVSRIHTDSPLYGVLQWSMLLQPSGMAVILHEFRAEKWATLLSPVGCNDLQTRGEIRKNFHAVGPARTCSAKNCTISKLHSAPLEEPEH